jgi:hypothetical protein
MKIGDALGCISHSIGNDHPSEGCVDFAAMDRLARLSERAKAAVSESGHVRSLGMIDRSRPPSLPRSFGATSA